MRVSISRSSSLKRDQLEILFVSPQRCDRVRGKKWTNIDHSIVLKRKRKKRRATLSLCFSRLLSVGLFFLKHLNELVGHLQWSPSTQHSYCSRFSLNESFKKPNNINNKKERKKKNNTKENLSDLLILQFNRLKNKVVFPSTIVLPSSTIVFQDHSSASK